jgi:steroid delta-isomerase-like uncharacterized protein
MSADETKAIVRRFWEAFNRHDLDATDALVRADFVDHETDGSTRTREGRRRQGEGFLAAFPDAQFTLEDLIAEGDRVAYRFTYRGTHQGPLMGTPPTAKAVSFSGMAIDRVVDGQIVEQWANFDTLSLLQQLGAIPSPSQAGR